MLEENERSEADGAATMPAPKRRRMNANVDADNDLMATLIMLNESDDDDALGGDNSQDVAIEIERYRKKSRISLTDSPFAWWNGNKCDFPRLARLARIYLATPPTSVPSEQLFSSASIIYTPRRNRLSGEKAEKLLFLKYNLCLLKFQY